MFTSFCWAVAVGARHSTGRGLVGATSFMQCFTSESLALLRPEQAPFGGPGGDLGS
jgi:hypothetical protein